MSMNLGELTGYTEFGAVPDATIPGFAAFSPNPGFMQSIYPGSTVGGVGTQDSVSAQYGTTPVDSAQQAKQYGTRTAAQPFYNQPIFWAVATFAVGVWLLAHLSLIRVKA